MRRAVGDAYGGGRQHGEDDGGQLRLGLGQRVEDGVPRLDPDAVLCLRVDDGVLEQVGVERRQHAVPAPVDGREVGERAVDHARAERRLELRRVQSHGLTQSLRRLLSKCVTNTEISAVDNRPARRNRAVDRA